MYCYCNFKNSVCWDKCVAYLPGGRLMLTRELFDRLHPEIEDVSLVESKIGKPGKTVLKLGNESKWNTTCLYLHILT